MSKFNIVTISRDLSAGTVVFLVALPLCLGIALASDAPPFAGILSGIIGGIVIGLLSGSHTSVSGPAAGLTAIVALQIKDLGTFEAFLLALLFAGLIQICLGMVRAGVLGSFCPSSVIKGLLAAIGVILILKQIPHVVGHDSDPEGDMSFFQYDHENSFSSIIAMVDDLHPGPAIIGMLSIILLVAWEKVAFLKKSNLPGPLVVVFLGISFKWLFECIDESLEISANHLVKVPITENVNSFIGLLRSPDFSQWDNPAVYSAGIILALVASLETLLNLNAVDKLDPQQRTSPPNRELIAQGVGNTILAMIGGIPMTSVIVRSSVNINAGVQTKLSAIFHGILLLICVLFFPMILNMIPLSCLAAILLVTGVKLVNPLLIKRMWDEGRYQFLPFLITLSAIVLTDILKGILIGLAVSITFILSSNLRRPIKRIMEKHLGGEVLHILLANQVSFLNRSALDQTLREVPRGGHVLIDASNSDYIDPDILELIRNFKEEVAPAHGAQVSLRGFRQKYLLKDEIQFVDYSTRELQDSLSPLQVLQILLEGNERFRTKQRLTRDLGRQLNRAAMGQHPLAVILSCIDSRSPAEMIFDQGLGDIFSIRIAGNVISPNILASLEYSCAIAGAKLILVVGHTNCGAVTAAVDLVGASANPEQATGCQHMSHIVNPIQHVIDLPSCQQMAGATQEEKAAFVDEVSKKNVLRIGREIPLQSKTIQKLVDEGRIAVASGFYNVATGEIQIIAKSMDTNNIHE
jgi:carbonic anhydrase